MLRLRFRKTYSLDTATVIDLPNVLSLSLLNPKLRQLSLQQMSSNQPVGQNLKYNIGKNLKSALKNTRYNCNNFEKPVQLESLFPKKALKKIPKFNKL